MTDYHSTAVRKAFREALATYKKSPSEASGNTLCRILEQLAQKTNTEKLLDRVHALEKRLLSVENRENLSKVKTIKT